MNAAEWNLVLRCKGQSMGLVSLYGSQTAMETRARLALEWEDAVEYLGPRIGVVRERKDSFASVSDLKDNLKKLQRNPSTQEDFQ